MSHAQPARRRRFRALVAVLGATTVVVAAWVLATWPWGPGADDPAIADPLVASSTPQPPSASLSRTPAPSRNDRGPQFGADVPVHLIGDSLAVGIETEVVAGSPSRTIITEAAEGRGTATSVALLAQSAASSSPVWIVSLGTNDNPDRFGADAAELIRLAGSDRCVVWFDVWRSDTQELINTTLSSLAAAHQNIHLIGWYETALAHPEWFTGTDVHPSSAGYTERGQLALQAVDEYCTL